MKRIPELIFILFFTFCLHAQETDTLPPRKFSWGLSFSPDNCYRSLNYRNSVQWLEAERNREEISKLGFTCGIRLSRRISEGISLDAGLLFSDKGEKTRWQHLNWVGGDVSRPLQSRVSFHYQYFDVPVKLNYYFKKNKLRFFVSAGISSNLFIRQRTVIYLKYENGDRTKTKNNEPAIYSRINFSLLVGAGLSIDLSKRLSLRIEPVFRRSLSPVIMNVPDKEYLYSVGLDIGIYLRLKNRKN